jgi:hypothetical protein
MLLLFCAFIFYIQGDNDGTSQCRQVVPIGDVQKSVSIAQTRSTSQYNVVNLFCDSLYNVNL